MRVSAVRIAVLAAATGLALVASFAGAAGKITTASKSVEISKDDEASGRAQCQGTQKAISGGFELKGPALDAYGLIKENKRDKRRGWEMSMLAEPEATSLKVFAYCRDEEGLANSSDSDTLADNEEADVVAVCPQGTKAISGGVLSAVAGTVYPSASFRSGPREWLTKWVSFADGQQATATVVCRDEGALQQVKKTRAVAPGDFGPFSVVAECPAGTQAVSGGFKSSTPLTKGGPYISTSKRVQKRKWKVRFHTGYDQSMTAYAYCEKA